jgi:hypothetical protein
VAEAIRKRLPAEAERAMRLLLKGTARDLAPAFPRVNRKRAAAATAKSGGDTRRRRQVR